MRRILIAALLAVPLAAPLPALADDRVLTIFGTDRCPENTICVRAPESERYRIPKNLREAPLISPERQAWAKRAESVLSTGKSGTGSCTAIGAGGWTGCWAEQMQAMRAERKQAAEENTAGLDE